jgi:hypothetical protein
MPDDSTTATPTMDPPAEEPKAEEPKKRGRPLSPAKQWAKDYPTLDPRHNPHLFRKVVISKPDDHRTAPRRPEIRGHTITVNGVDRNFLYNEEVALDGRFIAALDEIMVTRYMQKVDPVTKHRTLVERIEPFFSYRDLGEVSAEEAEAINTRKVAV